MQSEAAAGIQQCCQLMFQIDRADVGLSAEGKQASCIYWDTRGCTGMLFTVSKMNIPVNCTRILLQWYIFPGLYFSLEVVNIAVFSQCKKDEKAVQDCWKAWELF